MHHRGAQKRINHFLCNARFGLHQNAIEFSLIAPGCLFSFNSHWIDGSPTPLLFRSVPRIRWLYHPAADMQQPDGLSPRTSTHRLPGCLKHTLLARLGCFRA